MVININPNRINTGSGGKVAAGRGRPQDNDTSEIVIPSRAHVNYVPPPESLGTLIRSAVSALRRGIFWDRGTILNLLV
jgi:hypothetical protein